MIRRQANSGGLHPWRAWYLQRIVVPLVRSLGYAAAMQIAAALARGIFELHPPLRRQIERNMEVAGIAPGAHGREALAARVFEHAARFWTEVLFVPRCLRPAGVLRHVAWEPSREWDTLARPDRPTVLVSPYLGNPVIGILALCRRFGGMTVAVDVVSRGLIEAIWPGALRGQRLRAARQLRIVTLPTEAPQLGEVLAAGGRVCLLWGPQPAGGRSVAFLGSMSRFSPLPIRLAHRHGARLLLWACTRAPDPRGPFRLRLEGVWPDATDPATPCPQRRDAISALAELTAAAVRRNPEQYRWTRV